MTGQGLRLLIVDDDEEQLDMVGRLMTAHQFEVRTTSSPIGVSNIARRFAPNIILIDVNQPALSGDRILSLLRKNTNSGAKLVLFSSLDRDKLRELARSVSADGWISKGMDASALAKRLRQISES